MVSYQAAPEPTVLEMNDIRVFRLRQRSSPNVSTVLCLVREVSLEPSTFDVRMVRLSTRAFQLKYYLPQHERALQS